VIPAIALLSLALAAGLVAAAELEDLLMDLQLVPLDPRPSPDFALDSLDGKKVSLKDFRGRPILVYFWATW
jgi:cytochrome oxidase Cu insertion factor (SCO1/SenC/PrrC family)